jgi:two-component system chemotaxis response regulator CheV
MINEDMIPIIDVELVLTELIPSAGLDEEIEFTQEELTPKGVDREKVNLIYCEDSVIVQRVLSKVLKAAGYTNLKMYPNPTEALESLKNENSQKVDLIISDIEMPRMDGLTFCKELRGINRYKNTPFVFFSSTVSEEMKRKCASVGGNRAFSKPEIKQVISSLDELVSLSKSS